MLVLLADDEPDMRLILGRMLASLGHGVEAVPDGEALLRRAGELAPDAVLSDIDMPVRDGLSAGVLLRRARPGLRVLLMTGDPELADEARREGFPTVLLKPVSLDDLRGALSSF